MSNVRVYLNIFALCLIILLLSGCARFPSGGSSGDRPARTLYVSVTMLGPMQPGYRYYLAIGIDQNNTTGPVPVVADGTTGWGTISNSNPAELPPYFVRYWGASASNLGVAAIFSADNPPATPFMYNQRRIADNYMLEFEIDLAPIEEMITNLPGYDPNRPMVMQVNFITRENDSSNCAYDSFGINPAQDNIGFVTINLNGSNTPMTGDSTGGSSGGNYEGENGANIPGIGRESTAPLAGIDMLSWRIEIRRYQ